MNHEVQRRTPTQCLALYLAVIRGGQAVPIELVEGDVAEWIAAHGVPTAESVRAWALGCFELHFGLCVLAQRPVVAE